HWATVRDMKGDFIKDTEHKITEDAIINSSANIIPKGNVIIATRVGLGKICLIENDTAINQDLRGIIPKKKSTISVGYLFQWLKSIAHLIVEEGTGATVQGVKLPFIKDLELPLPPLAEQQRIVVILDEAFVAIAKAKSNAEQNLKNAKELFESYLQSVFENKSEGWEEKKLGEVCKVERGSSPRPIDQYFTDKPDGVNWIKIGDTKNVEKYIFTTRQKITKEGALKSRFVDIDDFILSNSMSFGKPYIMKTQGYIHDGWFVLRLPKNIDTEFFWYLLASPYTMNQFISLAAGAIVKNISGDLVKKTVLPIPSLEQQQTIVQKLDALSAETKKLEIIYQQKINDLDELKKSILQKAFNGELKTTQAVAA
ncbi:MAG: restriction endonuclease subunit S, partial [Methylococcaceae bacterium]